MNAGLKVPESEIVYPERDGNPLSDNTKQCRWIVLLFDNIRAMFAARDDVFVAADLLWYPVEGRPEIRAAPDVMVAFGRPKGDRGSYQQWRESAIAPAVAFEVLSPGNTPVEMVDKQQFYEDHGVEEYYVYDPDANRLFIYVRRNEMLRRVFDIGNFVSPRLGIRFLFQDDDDMIILKPDGTPFRDYVEVDAELAEAAQQRDHLKRLSARLSELSRKARRGEATADELAELDHLEAEGGA